MGELVRGSRILGTSPKGKVLEITFRGTHEWTHGREMNEYIKENLAEHNPAAVVFNLLEYQYAFGDDVTGLFRASVDLLELKTPDARNFRPVCIIARGTTYASLYDYFKSSRILDAFRIDFVSTLESALERLRERTGEMSLELPTGENDAV